MCGIFGYTGEDVKDINSLLLSGLKDLEYRGYDSSGVAYLDNGNLMIVREVGQIKNLEKKLKGTRSPGSFGIGHTRWATHGGVSERNSHPMTDCGGNFAVVHNGIIENYLELKKDLQKKGHRFTSETDTEVFPHLLENYLKVYDGDFADAVRICFSKLKGSNTVVVLERSGKMVGFRKGSPLVAAYGKSGFYISSDIPAISTYSDRIVFIEEGDGVEIDKNGIFYINGVNGKKVKAKYTTMKVSKTNNGKGEYSHFMLKEIIEQPDVVKRVAMYPRSDIENVSRMIKDAWGTYFTACGTASYAGLAATYMFSEIAKRHVNFAVASEFPYYENFLVERSLLIVASQSGETMDTLEAVRAAKRHNAKVLALVNVPGSSLTRLADRSILLQAGPEFAVVTTKAYLAKLSFFLSFAYTISGKYDEGVRVLNKVSLDLKKLLSDPFLKSISGLAKKLKKYDHIYIIGRGVNYATALEGALKLKEASCTHAEGFAAGELKHGVIALIEKGTPCIAIVANDDTKDAVLSNTVEMKSRGAYIIGISPTDHEAFDVWIKVPDEKSASCIVNVVPLQLLSYYLGIIKGHNPDKPRNLAKSVTVK